jgi:hypothetical protein
VVGVYLSYNGGKDMGIGAKKQAAVLKVLLKTVVAGKETSWTAIMAAVVADGIEIKNWMDVRGVLQWTINKKVIARTPGTMTENYVRIGEL